jgi:hypothetical protein
VTGPSVSVVDGPRLPGHEREAIVPVLQAEDGSYVGTVGEGDAAHMVAFDATGVVRWTVPKHDPKFATESVAWLQQPESSTTNSGLQRG